MIGVSVLVLPGSLAGEPEFETGQRGPAQGGLFVATVTVGKGWQDRLARLRDEGATAGDDESVVAGLRHIGKDRPHLRSRPKVMERGQPLAISIGDRRPLRNAQQSVMGLVKFGIGIVDVI